MGGGWLASTNPPIVRPRVSIIRVVINITHGIVGRPERNNVRKPHLRRTEFFRHFLLDLLWCGRHQKHLFLRERLV